MTLKEELQILIEKMAMFIEELLLSSNNKKLLDRSLLTNSIIKDFKVDKGIRVCMIKGLEYQYYPLLSYRSSYLKSKLGFDLFYLVKDAMSYVENKEVERYLKNELFNLINYYKTTIPILDVIDKRTFVIRIKPIVERYRESYRYINKRYFDTNDIDLEVICKIKSELSYKVIYVIPNILEESYLDINKIDLKQFGVPVVIDKYGEPVNSTVWNSIAHFNKYNKSKLMIRCLLPYKVTLKQGKILNENVLRKRIERYLNEYKKIPSEYEKKLSILMLSTIDTLVSQKETEMK